MNAYQLAEQTSEEERAARRAERAAWDAQSAARHALYDAEKAQKDHAEEADAAARQIRDLLRALAHKDDTEPTPLPTERAYRREITYQATFGRTCAYLASSTAGWSSKPKPQKAHAYSHRASDNKTADLYESPRGTSDPAKIETEFDRARSAALEAAHALTARAYLEAHDINPATAPEPAALVRVIPSARYAGGFGAQRYAEPTWTLALDATGEPIAGIPSIDSLYEYARRRLAGPSRDDVRYDALSAERQTMPETFATLADAEAYATKMTPEAMRLFVWSL